MQALYAEELCTMDKSMKGVVSIQLWQERQLENGVFPTQVGRWNARKTGKSSLPVGFRHPEMMHNVSFNTASGFLVWVLRHQAGSANSSAL